MSVIKKQIKILFSCILLLSCFSCHKDDEPSIAPIINTPIEFRVATYNIGDFSGYTFQNGSEIGAQLISSLFIEQEVDIIGLQEDVGNYGGGG